MENVELEQNHFIEGSQTAAEEPAYWKLLRGEIVDFCQIKNEGFLYEVVIEGMIRRGEVAISISPEDEKIAIRLIK